MLKEFLHAMVLIISFLFLALADVRGTGMRFCVGKSLAAMPDAVMPDR